MAAGGYGGAYLHLVNEFLRSIIEERKPCIDEAAAGLCAHKSAMENGSKIIIPEF